MIYWLLIIIMPLLGARTQINQEFLAAEPVQKSVPVRKPPSKLREEIVVATVDALDTVLATIKRQASHKNTSRELLVALTELSQYLLALSRSIIAQNKLSPVMLASKTDLVALRKTIDTIDDEADVLCCPSCVVPTWVSQSVKTLQKYVRVIE